MVCRAPNVTWEAVFLPLVEAALYGMNFVGIGKLVTGVVRILSTFLVVDP